MERGRKYDTMSMTSQCDFGDFEVISQERGE